MLKFGPVSILLVLLLISSAAYSEEVPVSSAEATSTKYLPLAVDVYYSNTLKADLLVEWMYIDLPGRGRVTFWGARIVRIDDNSPLNDLPNVQLGDVITRLDGISIARNMVRRGRDSFWSPVQVERHYGRTQVRWIRSGTDVVLVDDINIDRVGPNPPSGPGPVQP